MTGYLNADGVLPGTVWDTSQFQIKGVGGACGVAGLDMAESYGLQSYIPFTTMYNRMRSNNLCAADGVTDMVKIERQAQLDRFKTEGYPTGYPSAASWLAWAKTHLESGAVVVCETSRAQTVDAKGHITGGLRDVLSGARMDAGALNFHFNDMVGYFAGGANKLAGKELPQGFWMLDGDSDATNPVVNGARTRVIGRANYRQFYSFADLASARLYDLLAIYPRVTISPPNTLPAMPANYAAFLADAEIVKNGWKYGTYKGERALIAYDGTPVWRGFADWICAHPSYFKGEWADNIPLAPEESRAQVEEWNAVHGAGTVQTFRRMRLCWTAKDGCYAMWLGNAVAALERATGKAA